MIDKVRGNELMDAYGSLLTRRQQEILYLYFEEDFSYYEISEDLDISRAAVMDAVHKGCKQFEKFEENIGYIKKRHQILALCEEYKDEKVTTKIKEIV